MKTDEPKSTDDRGLRCRDCGCRHFCVVYTRPSREKTVIRRRACRNCGKRITTWERQIGQ